MHLSRVKGRVLQDFLRRAQMTRQGKASTGGKGGHRGSGTKSGSVIVVTTCPDPLNGFTDQPNPSPLENRGPPR